MKKRKRITKRDQHDMGLYYTMLQRYENAEEDGHLIYLPVKVGQHIRDIDGEEYVVSKYYLYSWLHNVIEYEASHIEDDVIIRFKSTDIGKRIRIISTQNVNNSDDIDKENKE